MALLTPAELRAVIETGWTDPLLQVAADSAEAYIVEKAGPNPDASVEANAPALAQRKMALIRLVGLDVNHNPALASMSEQGLGVSQSSYSKARREAIAPLLKKVFT